MDYMNIGLIIGSISTIVFLILMMKNRWFKDGVLEDLYLWWDGERHNRVNLSLNVVWLVFFVLLTPVFISLTWGVLLPIRFIVFIVLKIRNRNIKKNNRN
tara:strand:+ start:983 stop:1282 length:300 start_codon:yes stop_codon:yes gene_type:complete